MTDNERYIQAAIAKWGGDEDISIDQEKDVTFGEDGAYVHAWLYVCNDELEPATSVTQNASASAT